MTSGAVNERGWNQQVREYHTMGVHELPKTIECGDALEFLKEVHSLGRRGWVFRGHAQDNEWRLESSLHRFLKKHGERFVPRSSWYRRERATISRFRDIAHLHLRHLPEVRDDLAWLALMQHYGGPTRLLDFTFNPVVALYFAVREVRPGGGPFSVHAIHLDTIRFYSRREREKRQPERGQCGMNPAIEDYCIGEKESPVRFVGAFDGNVANERLAAQEGLFLVGSRIDFDYESWLGEVEPKDRDRPPKPHGVHWLKYLFPNSEESVYYDVVKQITQMGMSAIRLFPGLDGVCESFKFAAWLEVSKDLTPGT